MILLLFLLNFSYKINGYFTWRYDKEFYLYGSEINFRFIFGEDYDRLLIFLQIPFTSSFTHHFWQHYGDGYFHLKNPMGNLNLKIGRFDIPFSLLKYYDTHFLIFQPLYEDVLGYKKNIGVSLFGYCKDFLFDFNYSFKNWNIKNSISIFRFGLEKEKTKLGFTFLKEEEEKFAVFDINIVYLLFDFKGEIIYSFKKKKGIFGAVTFTPFGELETKFGYKYWEKENNFNLELTKNYQFLELKLGINYLFKKEFKPIIQGNFKI